MFAKGLVGLESVCGFGVPRRAVIFFMGIVLQGLSVL